MVLGKTGMIRERLWISIYEWSNPFITLSVCSSKRGRTLTGNPLFFISLGSHLLFSETCFKDVPHCFCCGYQRPQTFFQQFKFCSYHINTISNFITSSSAQDSVFSWTDSMSKSPLTAPIEHVVFVIFHKHEIRKRHCSLCS